MSDAAPRPLDAVYVIGGTDRGYVARAVRRLRGRIEAAGGTVEALDAGRPERAEPPQVLAACNSLGLFGGDRLVLVENADEWRKAELDALTGYLADPAPGTVLALVAGPGARRNAALFAGLAGATSLTKDLPEGRELAEHVRTIARRVGANLEPDAVRRLVALFDGRAGGLEAELEKLAAYAAGDAIDEATVDLLAPPDAEREPWPLLDALDARDPVGLLRQLERRAAGERRPEELVHPLVGSLAAHLRRVERARIGQDAGEARDDVAKTLGIRSPYQARRVWDAARGWPPEAAAAALVRLSVLDYEAKGGSRQRPDIALERALVDVVAGRTPS